MLLSTTVSSWRQMVVFLKHNSKTRMLEADLQLTYHRHSCDSEFWVHSQP